MNVDLQISNTFDLVITVKQRDVKTVMDHIKTNVLSDADGRYDSVRRRYNMHNSNVELVMNSDDLIGLVKDLRRAGYEV